MVEKQAAKIELPQGEVPRRDFIATCSTLAMAGGLAAGYGMLGAMAVQFLYPPDQLKELVFVSDLDRFPPGSSLQFDSPDGSKIVIARAQEGTAAGKVSVEDFIALSSVCPHLGCRVHWELQNQRFFCPCHNGAFDPQGKATAGPPLSAGQSLPRYPLSIENNLLYILLPVGGLNNHNGLTPLSTDPSTTVLKDKSSTPADEQSPSSDSKKTSEREIS